jgi:2OG-Fe(II) oxygenase superfamily
MSNHLFRHNAEVFTLDGFLTADECQSLIDLAEDVGFESAGVRMPEGQVAMPLVRNNERCLVESKLWVDLIWNRLSGLDLPNVDSEVPYGLPKDLRFYKYSPGQRFKRHKDGPWKENGRTSKLTLLVYLNEEFVGGTTDFLDVKIEASVGKLLLFVHPIWHEGTIVTGGIKYVLRSDVLYEQQY